MIEGAVDAAGDADGCMGCVHGLHCMPALVLIVAAPALLIWMI